jgi:hypothetical protein
MTLSLANCVPIIISGASNSGPLIDSTLWPAEMQAVEDVPYTYQYINVYPWGVLYPQDTPNVCINTWQPLAPVPGPPFAPWQGRTYCTWAHALGYYLTQRGIRPAIMNWVFGSSPMLQWTQWAPDLEQPPGTRWYNGWLSDRYAELINPRRGVSVFYGGQSGLGTGITDWASAFQVVIAANRLYLGANAGALVVEFSSTELHQVDNTLDIMASQVAYVRTDLASRLVQDPAATFQSDGYHLDVTSQLRLAALVAAQVESLVSSRVRSILNQ